MSRILVLGGYGVFGRRIVERLAGRSNIEVVIAGRDLDQAQALVCRLRRGQAGAGPSGCPSLSTVRLDAQSLTATDLSAIQVDILINTVGPFQKRDYRVALAAINAGAHYIDLADARTFVNGISNLDAVARQRNVLVTSGASSVPSIAAAVIDTLVGRFGGPFELRYAISPGNRFDPGRATVESVLGALGQRFTALEKGAPAPRYGWQPLHIETYPGVGKRLLGSCDIPDLDLFPARYPSLKSQLFLAGADVKAFHIALFALSWLARWRLVNRPERLATPLLALKRALPFLGSDTGVMSIQLKGHDHSRRQQSLRWILAARSGTGPFVPATPAVIVAMKLAAGALAFRGATPCVGLFSLDELNEELGDLDIRTWVECSSVEPT